MNKKQRSKIMEETIRVKEQAIQVVFKEHSVHIRNNDALEQLLENDIDLVTGLLAEEIKTRFREQYQRELDISTDSLVVEIWGHVYCAYLARVLDNLVRLRLMEKLADKIIAYCEMIDCGEPGYDSNRAFWDLLAPFRSKIAGWLAHRDED